MISASPDKKNLDHKHTFIDVHEGDAKNAHIKKHNKSENFSIWKEVERIIVIHPDTAHYQYWRMFIMLLQMLSSILYSFYAAFRHDLNYPSYEDYYAVEFFTFNRNHYFHKEQIDTFSTLTLVIELIFLFEMFLSSITSYIDVYDKRVTDLSKIRKNYLENGFLWDLIAIIPFPNLFHFNNVQYFFLIKCTRLIEAFKILDVKNFSRELKRIYKKDHDKVC